MNSEKARELFSDYREGALSPQLSSAFEAAIASDSSLKEEYREFDLILTEFETGSPDNVQPPFDLHDKIMARIDKTIFEEKRSSKRGWFSGWRLGLVGAAGLLAVVSAISALNNAGGEVYGSGLGVNRAESAWRLKVEDGGLYVSQERGHAEAIVKNLEDGSLVTSFVLDGAGNGLVKNNESAGPAVFRIEIVSNEKTQSFTVAMPGTVASQTEKGDGNVLELAKAAASFFRLPVVVQCKDKEAKITWMFETGSPTKRYGDSTSGQVQIDERAGLLHLTD
jgi:hypothetical protein